MTTATPPVSTATPPMNYGNMPLGEGKTRRTTTAQASDNEVYHPNVLRIKGGAPPPESIHITQDKIVALLFRSNHDRSVFSFLHPQTTFKDIATFKAFLGSNEEENRRTLILVPPEGENVTKIMTQLVKIWGQDTVSRLTTRGDGLVLTITPLEE